MAERIFRCKEHGLLTKPGEVYYSLRESKHRCQKCGRIAHQIRRK